MENTEPGRMALKVLHGQIIRCLSCNKEHNYSEYLKHYKDLCGKSYKCPLKCDSQLNFFGSNNLKLHLQDVCPNVAA